MPTAGRVDRVLAAGQLVFAADARAGLLVIDATDPQKLILQDSLSVPVTDFWWHDHKLYVTSGTALQVYDWKAQQLRLIATYEAVGPLQWVRTDGRRVYAHETGKGVHILRLSKQGFAALGRFDLTAPVEDMQVRGNTLYLSSHRLGLLEVDVTQGAAPRLVTRYPATGPMSFFALGEQAAFFAGGKSITSVSLLPALNWENTATADTASQWQIRFPKTTPMGQYDMITMDRHGQVRVLPELLTVHLPKPKKPKFTMEDFKKILKQRQRKQQGK
jgi:hypothetical protein